ncbi:hypothetical protein [Spirosoma sp.]|uniref:hypothetical protein n=1 Tax=Spirosoma sp. TaxID=1899569 RepID=UPI003B3B4BE7
MKLLLFQLVTLLSMLSSLAFGQISPKTNYFGLRAGYLRTATTITASQGAKDYGTKLVGIADRSGFYSGVFYHHNLGKVLAYRLELNYQQKGIQNQDPAGNFLFEQPFHYIGFTPLFGITPLSKLSVFVGPEANLRVGAIPPGQNNRPTSIEAGISTRVSYRYKRIGIEVSYFNAFNTFNSFEVNPIIRFDFKNQNWQAGLFFALSKLKKDSESN